MAVAQPRTGARSTHDVLNQAPPLEGYNVFESDLPLTEALDREGGSWAIGLAREVGELAGGDALEWGRQANENPPILHTHDAQGNRIDEVEFHPAWHELMKTSVSYGVHSLPWRETEPGAYVARAAIFMLISQAEGGHLCPMSMTTSALPTLRHQPEIADEWEPLILSNTYDPGLRPASRKAGVLFGMALTEKQGGSDVRANTSTAEPLNGGGPGGDYEITGHKWFCSAPMCDAFLVLAQADEGLSCFILPRVLPDGARNSFEIQRLKDKMGNRSNASCEVEFRGSYARMVGEAGRGVRTIIEMVNHTRLDCVLGSAAGMRKALTMAMFHTSHRSAFGKLLIEQPLMRNVLADLSLESEAATVTAMRLARSYDSDDESERLFKRLATAVSKYWICNRATAAVGESLECFGGNGYVEDSGMPRIYREIPVNSIWEGSANVICLDVLRGMVKSPGSVEIFFDEIAQAESAEPRLASFASDLRRDLGDLDEIELRARGLVERMALALQASLLVRFVDPAVADAFCASRLERERGLAFGTLPRSTNFDAIIGRSQPRL